MKKKTSRFLSVLLAVVMLFSLLPVSALAAEDDASAEDAVPDILQTEDAAPDVPQTEEEAPDALQTEEEAPAFIRQPQGGQVPEGEGFTLVWALNRTPDSLELVREEERFDENGETQIEWVSLMELDPAACSAVIPAPAPGEEPFWRLRALFGEAVLLSETFTVTVVPEPAEEPELVGEFAPVGEAEPAEAPESGDDIQVVPTPGYGLDSVDFGLSGGTLWNLYDDGTLEITNSVLHNPMADYDNPGDAPWYQYRDQIYTVRVGSQVSHIGSYAFYGLTRAFSFQISGDVKTIGSHAFEGCVRMGEQPGCYGNVIGILPSSVESIGAYAFKDCTGLTAIYPLLNGSASSLKSVDVGAFSGCTGLTQVVFPGQVKNIPAHCFENCTRLNSFVTTSGMIGIGSNAFEGCTGLQYAGLGSGVQSVWGGAFSGCTSLAEVHLPTSLIIVSADAFSGCDLLTRVYFDGKLSGWPRVEEYISPVGNDALLYAELVLMEDDPDHMCGDDLQWCVYGDTMFIAGSGAMDNYSSGSATPWASYRSQIKTVKICTGVTAVGGSAFSGCGNLKTVYLPNTVIGIRPWAFYGCSSLTDVYYHGTLTAFQSIEVELYNDAFNAATKHYLSVETGACGIGVIWTYDGTSLTITGNGSMNDWNDTANVPWRAYVNEIPRVQIGIGVTKVGKNAFNGCTALTEVSLPMTLKWIGDNAFRGCTALGSIALPDSVNTIGTAAFRGCSSLSGIEFPAGVTSIPDECCYGCSSMHAPGIPDAVTSIGVSAFEGCSVMGLASASGVVSIGDRAFYRCAGVTDAYFERCTQVGEDAFFGCTQLSLVNMPALATVGESAFQNCRALHSVSLPAAVTVGPYAFHGCTGLSAVHLPAAESIGSYAFVNCAALHGITLPATLRSIGVRAFDGSGLNGNLVIPDGMETIGFYALANTPITAVTIPTSVTVIEEGAFSECASLTDVYYDGAQVMWAAVDINETANEPLLNASLHLAPSSGSLANNVYWSLSNDGVLTISGGGGTGEAFASAEDQPWHTSAGGIHTLRVIGTVTSIPRYCCAGMTNLTTVELCDSVGLIGNDAFNGCTSLTDLTLPARLKTINANAFKNCSGLTGLELPDGLTTIGNSAFYGCAGLTELVIPNTVTAVATKAFENCSGITELTLSTGLTQLTAFSFSGCTALTQVEIHEGVTRMLGSAFYNCESLEIVRLPHSLTLLGENNFYNCSAITDVWYNGSLTEWKAISISETGNEALLAALLHVLPTSAGFANGLTWSYTTDGMLTISGSGPMPDFEAAEEQPWFDYGQMITGVRVLDGVTSVGACAFLGLARAKTAELADGITQIGVKGFSGCTGLETLNFPARLQIIQPRAFQDAGLLGQDLVLPEGLIAVYDYAFSGAGMDSVAFPNTVRILGENVFRSCPHLMGLNFPSGVSSVPQYFCAYCPEFMVVSFPEGVTNIGEGAFRYCGALEWVQFPSTLQTIGNSAFGNVGTVELVEYAATEAEWAQVSIGSNNTAIAHPTKFFLARGRLFGDIFWWVNSQGGLHVRGPGAMPDFASQGTPPWYGYRDIITGIWVEGNLNDPAGGVTYVSDYAFAGLEHVDYVSINNCCAGIGDHALEGLSALPYVYLPDALESIGDYAFAECSGMNYLEFPAGVADIGESAFEGCSSLSEVVLPESLSYGGIGKHAFADCTGLTGVVIRGLDEIPEGAFYHCTHLLSVTIPVSVTAVRYGAFGGCSALMDVWYEGIMDQWNDVTIENYNDPLRSASLHCAPGYGMLENGIQWSYSEGVLTISGEGPMPDFENNWDPPWFSFVDYVTGVEITEGVTSVGEAAFTYMHNVTGITLPDGLTEIGSRAFTGCDGLASVTLPASLSRVGAAAFHGCEALADVYYPGSRYAWETRVEIGDYNAPLLNAAFHCTIDGVPIDKAHFPDDVFRAWVTENADSDADRWLSPVECETVTEISCGELGIASLTGIGYFADLDYLDCSYNLLTTLDLSGNTKLTELDCSCNEALTALDLSPLPDLELLTCSGCVTLTELDLSANPDLTEVDCRECALTDLDLNHSELWYLDCGGNALTALDLSGLPALRYLWCNDNAITELDLDHPELYYIECYRNPLTSLDLSGCPALVYADCSDDDLTELVLGELPALKELYCHNNSLSMLDLTGCDLVLDTVLTTQGVENEGTMIYSKGSVEFYVDPGVILITGSFTISGVEASSSGIVYNESLGRYWLADNTRTLTWKDDNEPGFTALSSWSVGFFDSNSHNVTEEPVPGEVYLVHYGVSTSTQGQGLVDFSELTTANCSLEIPGFTCVCYRVSTREINGYDTVDMYFRVIKDVPDGIPIDEAHFPDPIFRAYVEERLDPDFNGYLTDAECERVHGIDVDSKGIGSLSGIEYFCELETLNADYNSLSELDLTGNPVLRSVSLFENQIEDLDLTGLELLTWLSAEENRTLTALDLSTNTALESAWLCGNHLTELDVSMLTALKELDCSDNDLTSLDVSHNLALTALYCVADEPLTELVLGKQISLKTLFCYFTALTELDISGCPILADAVRNGTKTVTEDYVDYSSPLGGHLRIDAGTELETSTLDIEFNHSCSFDNNLTINYYAPAAALEGYDTFRLVLQKQVFNGDGSSCSWDEYEITDCVDRTSGGKRYKVFSFSNIAAMEMGNEISAVLYAEKEGRLYQSPEDKYSVKTYAYSRLEKSTDGNFKRLLADMLNYGTAAQVYFNYNTGHPVNEEMTEEHKGYASPMPELVSIENLIETDGATAQYYGKTVEMNSSVEMKYYMTFDSGAPADTVRLVLSYTPVGEPTYTVSIPASQFEYRSSYNAYSAKLSSITAKDMSCKVTAKIYDGDTLISDILEYSIETYAYNRLEKSTDENFKTLVREMMKYGKSAENYFQNKQ